MKENFRTFPWRTSVQDACDWKEKCEVEVRQILENLQKEKRELLMQKNTAIANNFYSEAQGYSELITFDEGRIFSLRQILGEI
jgi:hypothetical protein